MERFSPQVLRTLAADIASAAGVPRAESEILADSLVAADLAGTSTHGLSRLAIYVKRIRKGLIDPKASLKVERQRAGTLAVDAGNGLGQVQAWKVLARLIPMARECGVASATIRNSQHFGALSYYCNRAADENMILIATSTGEPAMSPEGGRDAFFGTNPIAASFPTGKGFAIKIDLATSLVARGNIVAAQKKGESIPSHSALDPDGNPTTDASAALLGTVLTMAGHKGYALALMVEVLSSVMSGSAVGPAIGSMYKNLDRKQDVGHFFCLLDIAAFMDVPRFIERIDGMIEQIKSSRRRPGVEEILVPGERSARVTAENLDRGVKIDSVTLSELRQLARDYAINFQRSSMRDVLVSENIAGDAMDALKRDFDVAFESQLWKDQEKLLLRAVADARAIIVRNQTKVDRELIFAAKNLEVIGRAGVGLDNVDVKAASDAGVVVVWTPEQNSISVAELTIGLMLSLARQIPSADRSTRGGAWERQKFTGIELFGKTLGIAGLGRIGFLVAMRAEALGMKIIAHDSFVSPDSLVVSECGATLVTLEELLERSDVISVHIPSTPQTAKLFNDERFARMKPNALFINTSRGEVVDEAALIRALQQKKIAGAALDVRGKEPPDESPLAEMENVILTPHIAAFTVEGQRRVVESVCHDVAEVLRGRPPRYFVNFASPRKKQGGA